MSDVITVNTSGLEEAIRCAICENTIKSERGCDGSCRYDEKLLKRLIEAVKGCEVERPRGEWIETGRTNIYGGFEIECSVCHTTLMVSPNRWKIGENFCDVCGADMRGGDEK